jgi:hypothetical protein
VGSECGSVVEHLPATPKALSVIPSTTENTKTRKKKEKESSLEGESKIRNVVSWS